MNFDAQLKYGLNKLTNYDRTPLTKEQKVILTGIKDKLSDEDKKVVYEVLTIAQANNLRNIEEEIARGTNHNQLGVEARCIHFIDSVVALVFGVPPVETDMRIRKRNGGESGDNKPG